MKIKNIYLISGVLFGLIAGALLGTLFLLVIAGFSFGAWSDYYSLAMLIGVILGLIVSIMLFMRMGSRAELRIANSSNEFRRGCYFLVAGIIIIVGTILLVFYLDNGTIRYDHICFEELNTYAQKCYDTCGSDNSDKTRECINVGCVLKLEQEKTKCIIPNN